MLDETHIKQLAETIRIEYALDTYMMRKVRVSLTVNEELKRLAEEFGINLSAFLELKLFEHFRELILMKNAQNGVLRPGFEPGSRDRESRMIGRATPPEPDCGTVHVFINSSVSHSMLAAVKK